MKLCKNCKYFIPDFESGLGANRATCDKTTIIIKDPVYGEDRKISDDCISVRQNEDMCGMNGKWYEDKD